MRDLAAQAVLGGVVGRVAERATQAEEAAYRGSVALRAEAWRKGETAERESADFVLDKKIARAQATSADKLHTLGKRQESQSDELKVLRDDVEHRLAQNRKLADEAVTQLEKNQEQRLSDKLQETKVELTEHIESNEEAHVEVVKQLSKRLKDMVDETNDKMKLEVKAYQDRMDAEEKERKRQEVLIRTEVEAMGGQVETAVVEKLTPRLENVEKKLASGEAPAAETRHTAIPETGSEKDVLDAEVDSPAVQSDAQLLRDEANKPTPHPENTEEKLGEQPREANEQEAASGAEGAQDSGGDANDKNSSEEGTWQSEEATNKSANGDGA